MKVEFPDQLVPLNPNPDVETKNAQDQTTKWLSGDIVYMLDALQRTLGITGSDVPTSHDYRIARLEERFAALRNR